MKNVLMIVNPRSGKLKSKAYLLEILSEFCKEDYVITTQVTKERTHAVEIVKKLVKKDTELIVCCGGDGTLNEVITGLMQINKKLPVGYIPTGSTNDFANSLDIPLEPVNAAENIIKGENKFIDIGVFNGKYFSYIASFGAFSSVSYTAPQATKNILGHTAYVLEGIKDIGSIRPIKVSYEYNGEKKEGEYVFGCVANTFSIGGMLKLDDSTVNMNDGLFEVLLIKAPKSVAELHKAIWGLINSDFKDNIFEFFKIDKITFEMPPEIDWSLDGEYAKGEETVEISALKDAVILKTSTEV